ncbi:MAG: SCO1664 family protein [Chloroflexi bacterium]|nr:SCO1664 family protein [Chloroflexota bacterium]
MLSRQTVPPPETVRLLADGEIRDCQLAPQGSNYTFLATVLGGAQRHRVVYKPCKGEAPLWDFPDGTLYLREYAFYLLSEALNWGLVPYTIVRDGPHGVGSVQLFVESDPRANYFTLRESHREGVLQICALDVLANNADRKASHCLLGLDGRVWAIDHGITFHSDPKLRTVIWDFAGDPVPQQIMRDLESLLEEFDSPGGLRKQLGPLLNPEEVNALQRRALALLRRPLFPFPGPRRSVPWPWM